MKKLAVLLLAACVALGGAGCKNSVSDTVSGLVEDAGTAIQADGREYGQTYTFESGELVETAFFNFQVNEVSTAAEIEGYVRMKRINFWLSTLQLKIPLRMMQVSRCSLPIFSLFGRIWATREFIPIRNSLRGSFLRSISC